jgi:translocation and assembly module TamB
LAKVDTAGLDKAASASVRLDNLAPGRWDAGRLPLRQLQLELGATPNRLDRIEIRHLDAQLADERGPAGRAEGRGSWEGSSLRLQLQTRGVLPARLDARAGALEVGGPLTLEVQGLPAPTAQRPAASVPAAPSPPVAGWRAQLKADLTGTHGSARTPVRAELQAEATADRVAVTKLQARSGDASLSARLQAQRLAGGATGRGWQLDGEGELARFDPLPWWPGTTGSAWSRGPHRFDGRWQIQSLVVPESFGPLLARDRSAAMAALRGAVLLDLGDSVLAGVPLTGRTQLHAQDSALVVELQAQAANNRIELNGQWASNAAADRWQLRLVAPALAQLQPLIALLPPAWSAQAQELRGDLRGDAQLRGRWPAIGSQGQLQARAVQWRRARLAQGDVSWAFEPGDAGALKLQATLTDAQQGEQRIDALTARLDGTRADHHLQLQIDTPLRPPAWSESWLGGTNGGTRLTLDGQGQWQREAGGGSSWRADPTSLRIGGRQDGGAPWLDARALQVQVSLDENALPRRAQLAPGRVTLPTGAALRWTEATWQASSGDDRIDLRGELEPLAVAPLLARLQPDIGWTGDLALAGRIEMHAAERFDADVVLERVGGDLRIADEAGTSQALGLNELRLVFAAHDGLWQFAQGAAGQQLGEMAGSQVMRTNARTRWPAADAPLEGVLEMRVANLGAWGVWVPPGWRLGGSLQVSGALGGRFGAPEVRGNLRGSNLSVRNTLQGVGVSDGELSATLDGAVARVQRFEFKGGDGTLKVTGDATLGDAPSAHLRLQAERFRLLGRIDRRLVASGQAALDFSRDALKLDGRFVVDEGLIDFTRGDTPRLDSDVTVARPANGAASAAATSAERAPRPVPAALRNAQVALAIDLGDRLQVRGRGLDSGLRGDLKLSTPGGRMAVNGTVRTASGTYLAYAQKMTIERGELLFAGEAENPRLDIVAIRPNLDVRVGVAVTGTLANPRVRLFSEPEMSEMDKLSWLVLGRASDGLGRTDTALLQRAAVALLSGEKQGPTDQVLNQIGLSDFSLRQSEGETRETIVSLGRQLSQRWYVGYERSVNATTGTWQLIYRAAQRFTLRAQSGVENSLDVIWSWRWN